MDEKIREYVIEAGQDDWLYFAELLSIIQEVTGSSEDLLRRAEELAVRLVNEGVLVPGTLQGGVFTPWPTTAAESAVRIEREVAAMVSDGVEPGLGDLCWFDVPERFAETTGP